MEALSQDSIRASAGIDSKVEVEYDCEWNPGAAVVPQSKFLGVFHAADVIHIDASDVGWGANNFRIAGCCCPRYSKPRYLVL